MKRYNILDYGARIADSLSTEAIQNAINACFRDGGGEVVIPEGIFRTGAIRLLSGVTLHLLSGAYLEGSHNPEDYYLPEIGLEPYSYSRKGLPNPLSRSADPDSRWNHGLICGRGAHDIAIIGDPYSYIDGRDVYDPQGEETYRGPHGINLWDCENVTLRGYTLKNTGNWAHAIFRSKNVDISGVTVYAGHDGVDLFLCENAAVENCTLRTGDDCIAGFGSKDVTVRDCILDSSCSAIRFGGTNVLFERCTTVGPGSFAHRYTLSAEERARSAATTSAQRHSTLTAFLYYCDGRFGALPYEPGNIVVRDCTFDNVRMLFNMDFGRHQWCCNAPLRSITFENCRLTGAVLPIYIHGDAEKPIDFTLKNVQLSPDENGEKHCFLDAENCGRILLENVKLDGYDAPSAILRSEMEVQSISSTAFATVHGEAGKSEVHGH